MTVVTDKVLVVFLDDALASSTDAATTTTSSQAFDEVAARGSNGFLVLPATPSQAEQSDLNALEHLLHVERSDATGVEFKFPKMPVAFFSSSRDACALAQSLAFAHVVDTSDSSKNATTTMKDLLAGTDKQLVFVHTSSSTDSQWIDDVVRDVLQAEAQAKDDEDARVFVALVQTARSRHDPLAVPAGSDSSVSVFRPRQSIDKVDGQYANAEASTTTKPQRMLYSFYQKDRTRRDAVTRFDETQIDASGCYGAMSASMMLKELAFRIGFAPKYGA